MQTRPLSLHFHQKGLKTIDVETFSELKNGWRVLATGEYADVNFVNMIESKNAPIWGVQFHPEKIQFEWEEYMNADKSGEAVRANRAFADFFIEQARVRSRGCRIDEKLVAFVYKTMFTGGNSSNPMHHFTQVYLA